MLGLGALPLLAGLACQSRGTADACSDPTCRQDAILELWTHDRAAAVAAIDQLPDPVEQEAALKALFLTHGDEVAASVECESLGGTDLRTRCLDLRGRRHLWSPADGGDSINQGARLPPTGTATELRCEPGEEQLSCAVRTAKSSLTSGDTEPGRFCLALENDLWRDECLFRTGENVFHHGGSASYADAAGTCRQAGQFLESCVVHLSGYLATEAGPDIATADPESWAASLRAAEMLREYWRAPELREVGSLAEEQYWAKVMAHAVDGAGEVAAGLESLFPAAAQPHLRGAVAWRMASVAPLDDPIGPPLNSLIAELDGLLAGARFSTSDHPRRDPRPVPMFRPGGAGAGPSWEYVTYLGSNEMRVVAPERQDDLAICVLEAFARFLPDPRPLLESGAALTAEHSRWTADRLLQGLDRDVHNAPGPPRP